MALTKRLYVDRDHTMPITADNLNAIQDEIISNTGYVICTTAANTAAKTVTVPNFTLAAGSTVKIKFNNGNTAASPTLSINSATARAITSDGSSQTCVTWPDGAVLTLLYDGSKFNIVDYNNGTNLASHKMISSGRVTITPTSGSNYSSLGSSYYYKVGTRVHVHIGISGLTASTLTDIFIMPDGFKPYSLVAAIGTTGTGLTGISQMKISSTGLVTVYSASTYACIDIEYDAFY